MTALRTLATCTCALLAVACSRNSRIEDAAEVQELEARSRQAPRPELDEADRYYAFESRIALVEPGRMRFEWEDGLPLVAGEVNGIPVRLVPDTAAYGPMLYLDWVAARACDVYRPAFDRSEAPESFRAGFDWALPGFADHAAFGDLSVLGARVEIIEPLPYALRAPGDESAELEGLIGIGQITTHVLFAYPSLWDLPAGTIRFATESEPLELPAGARRLECRWEEGTRRVWLTVESGERSLELLLDSGSQITILPQGLLPTGAELDLDEHYLEASGEESTPTPLHKVRLPSLRIGGFELRDLQIGVAPDPATAPEPTLSMSDLREYGLLFRPASNEVHVFAPDE